MRFASVTVGVLVFGFLAGGAAAADKQDKKSKARLVPQVGEAVRFATSPAFRDIKPGPPALGADRELNELNSKEDAIHNLVPGAPSAEDPVVQRAISSPNVMPAPTANFAGISNADNFTVLGFRVLPPDTNGDVGPNHYVQTVNLLMRVFNKAGTALTPAIPISSLFTALGGICSTSDDGDPIVLYDPLADRWLVSQFALPNFPNPPYHQCIAISQTGDPTGAYHLYDFITPGNNLNDYPHFGVWPDAYYMTDNQFLNGSSFNGGGAFAFNRAKMLAGDPTANFVYFNLSLLDPTIGGQLPSDLDGPPPPIGTPNFFAYYTATEFGDPFDGLRIFEFHVDFATPANSTFTERADSPVAVAAFDPDLCGFSRNCIPQPSPGVAVDSLADRIMHRLQYRNFGTHESLVVAHSVDVGGDHAGVRYYEVRRTLPGGTFAVNEQASFAPDADHRWMPSAAMDHLGNLAVGYSVSSTTTLPSIRYAGRLAADPPNSLAQGEATLVAGTGVQTNASGRWGDYSALTVDPVDDCTFWYTQEYYTATGELCPTTTTTACWKTRVGSFTFPGCTAPAQGTIAGTVRDSVSTNPITGATVATNNGFVRITGAPGTYSMTVPVGTYSVSASAAGYFTGTAPTVVVTAGATTTRDFDLVAGGPPVLVFDSRVIDDSTGNNNGVIDFNECVNIHVTLENTGLSAATAISGTLSTTTTGVTVGTATSTYPDIAPAGTGANTTPFQITTAPTFVVGTAIAFTLNVTTTQGPFTVTFSVPTGTVGAPVDIIYAGPPVPIPDNLPAGAAASIPVAGVTGNVSKVTATVFINHTWDADLNLSLIGPDGTTVPLSTARGGQFDNFGTNCPADANDTTWDDAAATAIGSGAAPFVGSFRPETPLSAFAGKVANGTWQFKGVDTANLDTGNINCVKLTITPVTGTDGGGPTCGTPTVKFYALPPCRVADTRTTTPPALGANTLRTFPAAGVCSIPADATAIAIVATVVGETDFGDLRIFPAGLTPIPLASTLNFAVNHVKANNAIVPLGTAGAISVQCDMPSGSTGTTNFLFDVFGYFK
jgi:subtilisin-like proprotein convertase family protein